MLKRGGKNSYNPYSTSQRVRKAETTGKDKLDILPNKHNIWLKQVRLGICMASYVCNTYDKCIGMLFCFLSNVGTICSSEQCSLAVPEMHLSGPKL